MEQQWIENDNRIILTVLELKSVEYFYKMQVINVSDSLLHAVGSLKLSCKRGYQNNFRASQAFESHSVLLIIEWITLIKARVLSSPGWIET